MADEQFKGIFYNNGNFSNVQDILAVEVSLTIAINGVPFTVTMRTPGFELELIRGLLYSEEVFRDLEIEPEVEILTTNAKGYVTSVNIKLPDDKILKDFAHSRNIVSASSCGLCGRTSFEDSISKNSIEKSGMLDPSLITTMFEDMSKLQDAFHKSGGTHAAGAYALDGELLEVREDIGRHNAVDKVIGGLINKKILYKAKCLIVSGRISYEIVNKALSGGISFLASVSAPSSMAVENAEAAGMTLLAFCRNNKLTIYSHPERVLQQDNAQVNRN